jgi:predicted phosphodiesterase
MTKILIVGDTHSDAQFVSNIHTEAKRFGVKTIVQLGDFGYNFDNNVIASIKAWLDRDPEHQWFWLDGNHDQHDFIEGVILQSDYPGYPVPYFHERMFYCHRGSVTEIGGKTCMFMGGAYSIDKAYRKEHISWWPQEMIRQSDVQRALELAEGRKIDVLFSHDCPTSEFIDTWLKSEGYKVDHNSTSNRQALTYVVDSVRPQDLYHGHYHYRYDSDHVTPEGWKTHVHGVGANVQPVTFTRDPTARYGQNFLIEDW